MSKLGIIKLLVFGTLMVALVSLLVLFYYSVYFTKFRIKFVYKLDSSNSREIYERKLPSNTMVPGQGHTGKNISLDAISLDVHEEVGDLNLEQSINITFPPDDRKNDTLVSAKKLTLGSKQHVSVKNDTRPTSAESERELCPEVGPSLVGPLVVDQRVVNMEELEKDFSSEFGGWVHKGGSWRPTECKARVKMALIIPYRNRFEHLAIFLHQIHPILKRQNLDYRIFVVEQAGDGPFNRAMLFNIGFKEALKFDQYQCFVFHDVDLIPEDDRNEYSCPKSPRHLSVAVDKFAYRLPYANIFGGVGSFSKEHFELINGFSNLFWGWGGEDDDLFNRINAKGLTLTRPSLQLGRYKMVKANHNVASPDPDRFNKLIDSHQRMSYDGLTSLRYVVRKVIDHPLYTIVTVDINAHMTFAR